MAITTELQVVNTMLSAIGEAPVNTLEDSGMVEAAMARDLLKEVSVAVQKNGWHFNTEERLQLTPSYPVGEIHLPHNTLDVDSVYPDKDIDVVLRGNRLYDRTNHSYEFDGAVKVDLVIYLPYSDLPESAATYIKLRAARIFQERQLGTSEQSALTLRDETQAYSDLHGADIDNADLNVGRDNHYMRNSTRRHQ